MNWETESQTRAIEIVADLQSESPEVRLKAVRSIKNTIIGNRTKKALFRSVGAVESLSNLLLNDTNVEIAIQTIVSLGSFSHGDDESIKKIVNGPAIQSLFQALNHEDPKVIEAGARSIKLILQASSLPRQDIFPDHLIPQLISLADFKNKGLVIAELVTSIIARVCENSGQREIFAQNGGVNPVVDLLGSSYPKAKEAALDALASLSNGHAAISLQIANSKVADSNESVIQAILDLIKDKRPKTRLLAATCMTNLSRSKAIPNQKSAILQKVLPTLIKLLHESDPIREKAPLVISNLVAENEEYQKAACEGDAVGTLAYFVKDTAGPVSTKLKENSLLALSSICLSKEECRKQVIDTKILPFVVTALSHEDAGVREAACQCTRSLSRSATNLRTSLVDAGIAMPLFQLLSDPFIQVRKAACATLCNIVLEFSPMKKIVIENNGVEKLVEMTQSMDPALRLNSIWALKNLLYQADSKTKELAMKILTYERLLELMNDSETNVQEQALNLLRNLASSKGENAFKDIENIFAGTGDQLIPLIEAKLELNNFEIVNQALYVLVNLATGKSEHKERVIQNKNILQKILHYMQHKEQVFRLASVWCVINLTWPPDEGSSERVNALRSFGFEDALRSIKDDPDLDVRDRVKTALEHFEKERKMEH